MSSCERTTRECAVGQIPPEPLRAIRDFFIDLELGDPERETLACCETITERTNVSRLLTLLEGEQDTRAHTWMLLTSNWLIWVRRGDQTGMVSNAVDLKQVKIKEFKTIFSRDTGLEIYGYIGESKDRIRGYIGMGTEPVAREFLEQTVKTVADLKPASRKRGWFRWFSS
jgi:hypothetical protein